MSNIRDMYDLSTIKPGYITGKIYGFIMNNNKSALLAHVIFCTGKRNGIFLLADSPQGDCSLLDEYVAYDDEPYNSVTFEEDQYFISVKFDDAEEIRSATSQAQKLHTSLSKLKDEYGRVRQELENAKLLFTSQ
jgi:hypothetical protein